MEATTFSKLPSITTISPLSIAISVPLSYFSGIGKASKSGILMKGSNFLDSIKDVKEIVFDKTGTLTEDKIVLEKYLDIYGNEDLRILKHAFLNSYFQTGLKGSIDEAVIKRAIKQDMDKLTKQYKIVDEIPFDFSRRRLSVVVTDGTKTQLITKGAVEEILNISTLVDYKGEVSRITKEIKENIMQITKKLNEDGLRVIAVCQKNNIENIKRFSIKDEKNMVLLGFIGFLDPPKESAKQSIEKLNNAGIRVIVLTGDNEEVTRCVCEKVNINSNKIVSGNKLDKLSDMAILRILKDTNIFVKLSPIQKARVVRILRESNNIVGYIGDGINDSPSLVNSDVGI